MNPLRLAFGLLTAVPVGRLPEVDRRSAGRAMLLAPVTTLPVLVVLGLGHLAVDGWDAPSLVVAALVVTAAVMVTRAMHLDGLADTADGLSAGYDAPTSLRAMKASDVGPSGVAAVVLALLVQTASLAALLGSPGGAALAGLAWLASRHVLAWACRASVPTASPTGLGALVAGSVGPAGLAVSGAGILALGLAAGAAPGVAWWAGLPPVAAAIAAAGLLVRRCRARLGGITGDVLGACVEVALAAGLAAAAVLPLG